jgi:hypothetical protein
MQVHPTYYPDIGLWATDDWIAAPTIRALRQQLPPDARIKDYYPKGYYDTVVVRPRIKAAAAKAELVKQLKANAPPLEPEVVIPEVVEFTHRPEPKRNYRLTDALPSFPKVNWKLAEPKLRELFDQGLSDVEIAKQLNCTKNAVIGRRHRLGLFVSQRG